MEQHADARFAVNHTGPGGIQVNRAARIMTAETHGSFLRAGEMLEQAQKLADETTATAQAAYRQSCEQGYREGLERAHAQTTRDNIQLSMQRRRNLESLERDISALVLQTLRQILGEIDRAERVTMLVREALTRLGQLHGEIVLHVHPELAAEVSHRMLQWTTRHQSTSLTTIADPEIAPDACRVVCGSGSVEGNLQRQLLALESALHGSGEAVAPGDETPGGETNIC